MGAIQQIIPALLHGGDEGGIVSAEWGGLNAKRNPSSRSDAAILQHFWADEHILLRERLGESARLFVRFILALFNFGEVAGRLALFGDFLGQCGWSYCGLKREWLWSGNIFSLNDLCLPAINLWIGAKAVIRVTGGGVFSSVELCIFRRLRGCETRVDFHESQRDFAHFLARRRWLETSERHT